jgi:hypothetical protein
MTPHAERFSKVCMGNYKDKKTFPCGRTGRGGGDLDLKLFLNNPYLREKRDMRN